MLRSTIREYLCSEAMHHLGIPTTRALMLVSTEPVRRETVETAAALIRVADTHIRFGHFEYAAHHLGPDAVKTLADHTIHHHFPGLAALPRPIAIWPSSPRLSNAPPVPLCCGREWASPWGDEFHNMSITGDTFDYGPYAFLDDFDARYIRNHTDQGGRYAYNRQPEIGFINCQFLAHALTSLLDEDDCCMRAYETTYNDTFINLMRRKLGLHRSDNDMSLIMDTYSMLHEHSIDYTRFFRGLSASITGARPCQGPVC